MAAVTICSDFGAQKNKVWHCFHCFPSICHEVMGLDAIIFVFLMLSFKPTFALSFFTFIKRLFSSSSLSAIRVVSSAYLRLLIFLLAILIPACVSSSVCIYKVNHGLHFCISQRDWACTDDVAVRALITCLSGSDQWLTGADQGTVHALIRWLIRNWPPDLPL